MLPTCMHTQSTDRLQISGIMPEKLVTHNTFHVFQVLQAFAAQQGYSFTVQRRERVTWDKHTVGGVVYRSNHSSVLKQERNRLIQDGEIYIGQAICPIKTSKTVFDPETNKVAKKVTEVSGRKISLLKIRRDHLKFMSRKGLLRNTAADEMTLIDLQEHLKKNHGKILLYHKFSVHVD